MLTHITMDISLCPLELYQSAKFRTLAHALMLQNSSNVFQPFQELNLETWKRKRGNGVKVHIYIYRQMLTLSVIL